MSHESIARMRRVVRRLGPFGRGLVTRLQDLADVLPAVGLQLRAVPLLVGPERLLEVAHLFALGRVRCNRLPGQPVGLGDLQKVPLAQRPRPLVRLLEAVHDVHGLAVEVRVPTSQEFQDARRAVREPHGPPRAGRHAVVGVRSGRAARVQLPPRVGLARLGALVQAGVELHGRRRRNSRGLGGLVAPPSRAGQGRRDAGRVPQAAEHGPLGDLFGCPFSSNAF